jgi:hypothetical protein
MPTLRWNLLILWRTLLVALLAALAGYGLRGALPRSAQQPADNIPALVAHLELRGIQLRVIASAQDGDVCAGAYLTRTSKNWEQLSFWPRDPRQLSHWQDTVLIQPEGNAQARAEALALNNWQEGYLVYGQLILFGDPDLLAEIRTAMQE